jgi:hypothetical protein
MMTEKQFTDFANQLFQRFEQVEQRFAENHVRWKRFTKKMYMRFEHVFVRLDERDTITGLVSYKFDLLQDQSSHHYTELKEANIRIDERVRGLEI